MFFAIVGYNGRGFFPLWDTTEGFFSAVGYNGEGFPPLWDTTEEDFFSCGIQWRTISGWQTNFFLLYPTTQEIFLPLYPTPQQNLRQCTVSQKNLPHCVPQHRSFSFVVSHNEWYFAPLWDTTEEVFFSLWDTTEEAFLHCGIKQKWFFSFWDTTEEVFFCCGIQWKKIIQRRMIFLHFYCLSVERIKNGKLYG